MSNGRRWWLLGVVSAALPVVILLLKSESPLPANSVAERVARTANVSEPALNVDGSATPSSIVANASIVSVDESVGNDAAFRVNGTGELVLDEQTRLNIETLVASTAAHELYAETREQTENLPPAAARLAEELVNKFVHYQQAQRQTQPPDVAPATENEALRQLEELHALREAHFGAEVARRFYGQEEVIAREMIEVMRLENDQSLTRQEKLERAQALRERLPGVTAIEKGNRDTAATAAQQIEK